MKTLELYEKVRDTENIGDVKSFLIQWNNESEDFKDEYPLFCLNGLDFFNFQSTDGISQCFTLFARKSNEYNFNFDEMLDLGYDDFLKELDINIDDAYEYDNDVVGILYNDTLVKKMLDKIEDKGYIEC